MGILWIKFIKYYAWGNWGRGKLSLSKITQQCREEVVADMQTHSNSTLVKAHLTACFRTHSESHSLLVSLTLWNNLKSFKAIRYLMITEDHWVWGQSCWCHYNAVRPICSHESWSSLERSLQERSNMLRWNRALDWSEEACLQGQQRWASSSLTMASRSWLHGLEQCSPDLSGSDSWSF